MFGDCRTEDLRGQYSEGNISSHSALFYVLPYMLEKLLSNDPDRVLSKTSIAFRNKVLYEIIKTSAPLDLHGTEQILEKRLTSPKIVRWFSLRTMAFWRMLQLPY